MFPYENVMSIHNQKMAQFVSEREKDQIARMFPGRVGSVERMTKAVGKGLKSAGEVLANRRSRPIKPA
ncbi:MAG: hypothetical protein IH818_08165 [Acidobacteria bacterium]|nr:hypothetical protein [Acidobacteriota bacterium]